MLQGLQPLIDGKETVLGTHAETIDAETRRRLAADCFNKTWTLMEKADRTPEDDDEMLHCAHASRYHWGEIGTAANRARGEWQCSRMYTVLGALGAGAAPRAALPRDLRVGARGARGLGPAVRVRGARPGPRARRRRRGDGALPRAGAVRSARRSSTTTTARCSRPISRRSGRNRTAGKAVPSVKTCTRTPERQPARLKAL